MWKSGSAGGSSGAGASSSGASVQNARKSGNAARKRGQTATRGFKALLAMMWMFGKRFALVTSSARSDLEKKKDSRIKNIKNYKIQNVRKIQIKKYSITTVARARKVGKAGKVGKSCLVFLYFFAYTKLHEAESKLGLTNRRASGNIIARGLVGSFFVFCDKLQ